MTLQHAPWIILFTPLVAAGLVLFFGRFSKRLSAGLAIGAAAFACVLSWMLYFQPESPAPDGFYWLDFGQALRIPFAVVLDHLSRVMLVLVTTVATLVFTYSIGYMLGEEGYSRYFAGLSLFLFSMLGIVLADNFVMMFIFWELVGVSSYILIGHYYSRNSAAEACKQAFTVNRVGDFGFMLGILMLWVPVGSVVFADIEAGMGAFTGHETYLAIALVLVFCGTVGKSAQLPLHVWLPNSMEGPTPVSSLLHAATMVAAGVYMLARIFPIVIASELAMTVIAWVGGITCFVAGLMAIQQSDIKRILAYSTISQLGYMVLAIGVAPRVAGGDYVAMFHLFNHACFKCLLFLCAGSVIVAMHHEQNIWKMGALKNKMPVTFICMVIGGLALSGFPLFSGFFSKDLIIEWAAERGIWFFLLSAGGVFLTALYTFRLLFVVFLGGPRGEHARQASESPKVMTLPMMILAVPSVIAGFGFFAGHFYKAPHPEAVPGWVHPVIYVFLGSGILVAWLLYGRGPQRDPVDIPFFANRLYIDDAYNWMVRNIQGGLASVAAFFDRWVIDGIGVQGSARFTWVTGFVLRFLQAGNIQAYAFFFGLGVVILLYLLLSR